MANEMAPVLMEREHAGGGAVDWQDAVAVKGNADVSTLGPAPARVSKTVEPREPSRHRGRQDGRP